MMSADISSTRCETGGGPFPFAGGGRRRRRRPDSSRTSASHPPSPSPSPCSCPGLLLALVLAQLWGGGGSLSGRRHGGEISLRCDIAAAALLVPPPPRRHIGPPRERLRPVSIDSLAIRHRGRGVGAATAAVARDRMRRDVHLCVARNPDRDEDNGAAVADGDDASSVSATATATAALSRKTVKELRDIARGIPGYSPSKTRLKADLISFLISAFNQQQHQKQQRQRQQLQLQQPNQLHKRQQQQQHQHQRSALPQQQQQAAPTASKRGRAMRANSGNKGGAGGDGRGRGAVNVRTMPPHQRSPPSRNAADGEDDGSFGIDSDPSKNPRDQLVGDVLRRYPPLARLNRRMGSPLCAVEDEGAGGGKDEDDPSDDDDGELYLNQVGGNIYHNGVDGHDIRSRYHPILTSESKRTSDLEVVFVGTASCLPSSTRGTSCTAVKLGWRRNTGHGHLRHLHGLEQQRRKRGRRNDEVAVNGEGDVISKTPDGEGEGYDETFVGGTWLFDCGECTQLQLQRTSFLRSSKVTKIFLTHAHGDHTFGLPGLLCLMGKDRPRTAPPVEIYGPEGLRMWLRVAIRYSVSRIVPNYVVHELKDIPMAPEWRTGWHGRYYYDVEASANVGRSTARWGPRGLAGEDPSSWISQCQNVQLERDESFGEVAEGRDIYPKFDHPSCVYGAPIWEVEDEEDVAVHAAPMSHGVPCVGYVVKEKAKPGRLRPELVMPVVKRNFDALKEEGVKNPMKLMAVIKNLPVGSSYTFPDGTVIHQSEVVESPREGRKIVLCGDTADARAIEGLAVGADLLIHEATNTYLTGQDIGTTIEEVEVDARKHGHSTPFMAGDLARRVGAKRLVMNHFSARYGGDQSLESIMTMTRMERQAMKTSRLPETSVAAAWDFMLFPVSSDQ